MIDYVDYNVTGTNLDLNKVCEGLYSPLEGLDWTDTWFALNVQLLNKVNIPTNQFKKIAISFHTEYFNTHDLYNFFNENSDCKFLLLHDGVAETAWPSNVTGVQWISWGQQLDVAIEAHGISNSVMPAKKIISSLSNRHEFHKAAVTAFVQKYFAIEQYVLSWHDARWGDVYYLKPDFFVPEKIKDLVFNPEFQKQLPIKFDTDFNQSPVANGNWHHPAYEECAINLTNESIYNSTAKIGATPAPLSGPYLTEKTWKPLLAGRPFIPVGQKNTIQSLEQLGLTFDWGLDLGFDQMVGDFDRLLGIYQCLEELTTKIPDAIVERSQTSCRHNLDWIRSGNFRRSCDRANLSQVEKISKWQLEVDNA
jgi:hypothetical protein